MANKLNQYIDPLKLQGAVLMNLKTKQGIPMECLVIPLANSRIKKSEKSGRLGLSIDIVPNKDGKDEYGNTHWCKESTTKAERESADPPQLPFLGNAREFDPGGQRSPRPASGGEPQTAMDGESMQEGLEDDDIPF